MVSSPGPSRSSPQGTAPDLNWTVPVRAVPIHGIANNAIRYIKNRRRIGNRSGGRGAMDIHHPRAQKARGYKVVSLDSGDEYQPGPSAGGTWREWLSCDHRVDPADEAAFRLDFEGWLAGLSP